MNFTTHKHIPIKVLYAHIVRAHDVYAKPLPLISYYNGDTYSVDEATEGNSFGESVVSEVCWEERLNGVGFLDFLGFSAIFLSHG